MDSILKCGAILCVLCDLGVKQAFITQRRQDRKEMPSQIPGTTKIGPSVGTFFSFREVKQ